MPNLKKKIIPIEVSKDVVDLKSTTLEFSSDDHANCRAYIF
jgi:hypothetical protein